MPNVTLNGITFNGEPWDSAHAPLTARIAPAKITPKDEHIGDEVVAASGYETVIRREKSAGQLALKRAWVLEWEKVGEGTRAAVRSVFLTGATFTAVLPDGTFTVQCKLGEFEQTWSEQAPNGYVYYDLKLPIYRIGL